MTDFSLEYYFCLIYLGILQRDSKEFMWSQSFSQGLKGDASRRSQLCPYQIFRYLGWSLQIWIDYSYISSFGLF